MAKENNGNKPSAVDVADGVTAAEAVATSDDQLARLLAVPHGDVVIRSVRGPDGIDPTLGSVVMGRLYTIDFATALRYCDGPNPRFEPVLKADRTRFESAWRKAADAAGKRADLEKELAAMDAAK